MGADFKDYTVEELLKHINNLLTQESVHEAPLSAPDGQTRIHFDEIAPITSPSIDTKSSSYTLQQLMEYEDQDFIKIAYQCVLKRAADHSGFRHYLSELRKGRFTKTGILGRLRWSKEGRQHKVKIRGLLVRFPVYAFYELPVVGRILAFPFLLILSPVFLRGWWKELRLVLASVSSIKQKVNEVVEVGNASQAYTLELTRRVTDFGHEMQKATDFFSDEIRSLQGEMALAVQQLEAVGSAFESAAGTAIKKDIETNNRLDELAASQKKIETIEGEFRATVERIAEKQTEVNELVDNQLQDLAGTMSKYGGLLDELQAQRVESKGLYTEISEKVSALTLLNQRKLELAAHLKERQARGDYLYSEFQDSFRGTKSEIRERLRVYLPFIEEYRSVFDSSPVLDCGFGRGEMLEVCRERQIPIIGVDSNGRFVEQANQMGFDTYQSDIFNHLKKSKPAVYSVISLIHVIEHLEPEEQTYFYDLAYRALIPGGLLIVETPNGANLSVSGGTFYGDPTHKNPLLPSTTARLVELIGFEVEVLPLHPYEHYYPVSEQPSLLEKEHVYTAMDFAIMAKKK